MSAQPTALDACWKSIGVWGDRACPELKQHTHCRNCGVFRGAAASLLDREPPPGYREEWTLRVAEPRHRKAVGTRPVVIFRTGEEWLALPAPCFSEVAAARPVHSVPHRQDGVVEGLVNVRGELLLCLSLPALLGIEAPPARESARAQRRLLVISKEGERTAFFSEEVHCGHQYHPADLRPIPSTLALAAAPYSLGLLEWEDRHVGVLNEALFFQTVRRNLA